MVNRFVVMAYGNAFQHLTPPYEYALADTIREAIGKAKKVSRENPTCEIVICDTDKVDIGNTGKIGIWEAGKRIHE
jgi:hypothetical protein